VTRKEKKNEKGESKKGIRPILFLKGRKQLSEFALWRKIFVTLSRKIMLLYSKKFQLVSPRLLHFTPP